MMMMIMIMMMAGGEVREPLPPRAGRITGSRIATASGKHEELVNAGAGATTRQRAATRTGQTSSDIPRDRNAREIQGAVCFLSSLFALKISVPLLRMMTTSVSSPPHTASGT